MMLEQTKLGGAYGSICARMLPDVPLFGECWIGYLTGRESCCVVVTQEVSITQVCAECNATLKNLQDCESVIRLRSSGSEGLQSMLYLDFFNMI